MTLPVIPFSNSSGGNVLYKALTHPLAWQRRQPLIERLSRSRRLAVFDPGGRHASICALLGWTPPATTSFLVQQCEALADSADRDAVTALDRLPELDIDTLWIPEFDDRRLREQLGPWLPAGAEIESLAALRLPDDWLSRRERYLHPLNFATNQAFFRDDGHLHTRLTLCNYWSGYGARSPALKALLFDADGSEIARFDWPLGQAGATLVLDSRRLREDHDLPPFTGQLFLHVTGAAGHDVVKYVLDLDGDAGTALTATHDANAWPAERYGGLPQPVAEEQVLLWLQNPHPFDIADGELALSAPGEAPSHRIPGELPAMATRAVDVGRITGPAPERQWVLHCGRQLTRPRYEIVEGGRRRMAHLNVYRDDLVPDPEFDAHRHRLGKGYLLVAPVLDPAHFETELLVTPMSAAQESVGLMHAVRDPAARVVATRSPGVVDACAHAWQCIAVDDDGFEGGHLELMYDPDHPGPVDGWFHAIARYRHRDGHAAETSFGSHLFNGLMTYRNEPQSYAGPPPGLSTRLFVRLGPPGTRTWCQLIYPASTRWLPQSSTTLKLHDHQGREHGELSHAIPMDGSWSFWADELFDPVLLEELGEGAWLSVRDRSCRLFGYQGLFRGAGFSLDHLFGF